MSRSGHWEQPPAPGSHTRDGPHGGHRCTLFKNPFKTWEAFTERNRGIRMGFSRITATIGALVRSLPPSRRSLLCLLCPAAGGAGRSAGLSKPFLSRSVQGAFSALAPLPYIQQGLSPTEGHPPQRAQDHAVASNLLTYEGASACDHQRALRGQPCPWAPASQGSDFWPRGRCPALAGGKQLGQGPALPCLQGTHLAGGQEGVWAKS